MPRIFDIIEYPEELMREEVIHRFPEIGPGDFRIGSQLIVHESQTAVFFRDGRVLDVFGPGPHIIVPSNIPLLVDQIGLPIFNERTPFTAEVYFVSQKIFGDRKWGTPQPLLVGNHRIGFAYIVGWGLYSYKVNDPQKFVEKFIGSNNIYRTTDIETRLRSFLLSPIEENIYDICASTKIQFVAEIISRKKDITTMAYARLRMEFNDLGLSLHELILEGIRFDAKSKEMLLAAGLPDMPSAALQRSAPAIDPKFVFVIMSFDPQLNPVYDTFKNAARAVGLNAQRVSDQLGDYRITDKIIENIQKAFLVISDMTLERPNVYFELGYARGLGKTVIETAREGTNLHFDVKDWTCIFYSLSDLDALSGRLTERFEYELTRSRASANETL